MGRWRAAVFGCAAPVLLAAACGGSDDGARAGSPEPDGGGPVDAAPADDAASNADAPSDGEGGAPRVDGRNENRDRLLATYLAWLKAHPVGAAPADVCALWGALDPSARAVFLLVTARMQGAKLASDGSSMLVHVERLYRCAGGEGATSTDPGSCGGGEYNRVIVSIDAKLHAALVEANTTKGAPGPGGKPAIADIPQGGAWRDSHDPAGPHAPFDESDETEDGAPRGQVQFFADPTAPRANQALARQDLETLVDPYALEMDQDFDCVHNSNPLCEYVTYGPACLPETQKVGVDIYAEKYGGYDPDWTPTGCAPRDR